MKVYCILSDERAFRSKSPAMFSTVLKWQGIKGTYVPFRVAREKLGSALQSLKILNIAGANVTVPYKESVIPHLDILSEGANIIGAVNTIVVNHDQLKGYNTNAIGFMDALTSVGYDVENKSALVFGTGGAAMAVVFILNWLRMKSVIIAGRNEGKAKALADRLGGEPAAIRTLQDQELDVDMIVNATSASSEDESPELAALVKTLRVKGCDLVVDLNYDRPNNFWQKMALSSNIKFMDGLIPLAYQARKTFFLWTGLQIPPEDFLKSLETE